MTELLSVAALVLLGHLTWTAWSRALGRRTATSSTDAGDGLFSSLDPDDRDELRDIGRRVEAEFAATSPSVLHAKLRQLLARNVPINAVKSSGVAGLARMHFADGNVVVVRGRRTGDLARLAVSALKSPIHLAGFRDETPGIVLDIESRAGHTSVVAVAVGSD